jgi:nucleotide-binding universal stress UspA family protein
MIGLTRILCPVDFSDCSRLALEYAVAMGKWYGASVTAVHVFDSLPIVDPVPLYGQPIGLKDLDPDVVRGRLTAFVHTVAGDAAVVTELLDGTDARSEVLRRADAIGADLIVMGTHGRSGFEHLLLGSVAEKVVRKASCPVMLVPPHAQAGGHPLAVPFSRILCAVDFAETSRRACEMALELAEEADAHLTMLHAIEIPPELRERMTGHEIDVPAVRAAAEADALQRLRDLIPAEARTYCKVHTDVREGRPYRVILEAASESQPELIVMGVHGGGALDRLIFGSNTHAVLRAAPCPVLAVRTLATATHAAVA